MPSPIIVVDSVSKSFGDIHALDDVSFEVAPGTVYGLLGPNGAGKTTAVRVLTTLLKPDSGRATIAGLDVVEQAPAIRAKIGLAGQYAAVDEILSGRENLEMVGRLYRLPKDEAQRRAEELLERFDLTDAADRLVRTYSGGMRRRLDLAASLVGQPQVLFLDEPTTGLDPRSRVGLWEFIEGLVGGGTTLLLTTQYLEEADRLADQIGVIDHGTVIAEGTSSELKSQIGNDVLELEIADPAQLDAAAQLMQDLCSNIPTVDQTMGTVRVPVENSASAVTEAIRRLDANGIELADLTIHRPTLDDVFLTLTGRAAENETVEPEPSRRGRRSRA
jgi:ABC-2 type transport system ATP-binding protein